MRWSLLAALGLLISCQRVDGGGEADAGMAAPLAKPAPAPSTAIARRLGAAFGLELARVVRFDRQSEGLSAVFAAPAANAGRADRVVLPEDARSPLVIEKGGLRVRASLRAAPIAARVDEGALVYPGAIEGGSLAYLPLVEGAEQFAMFDGPPQGEHVLRYDIALEHVAGLRLVEGTLEFLSADGNPVLRTKAPITRDEAGRTTIGTLRVEGCSVDTSTLPPWGRPVTDPGASHCTVVAAWSDDGLSYPLVVDPAWTTTAGLGTKRYFHTATYIDHSTATCSGGCVLVTSGMTGTAYSSVTAVTELWKPSTGSWAVLAADPCGARMNAAAAAGFNYVFVGGGRTGSNTVLTCVSKWDAATGAWATNAPVLPVGRAEMAATSMWESGPSRGDVLFVGGLNSANQPVTNFEIHTGSSYMSGNIPIARAHAAAFSWFVPGVFGGTKPVCVAGGIGATGRLNSVSCATNLKGAASVWGTTAIPMAGSRAKMGFAQYQNQVWIGGGGTAAIDVIDLTPTGGPTLAHTTASIADRDDIAGAMALESAGGMKPHPVFLGGWANALGATALNTANVFDVAGSVSTGAMRFARAGARAVQLADGRVLVTGGNTGMNTGAAFPTNEEIFALQANGAACTAGGECASGFCADGVCCNEACGASCESCNQAGSAGTCKVAPAGQPATGHPACPAPSGGACGNQCDGANRTTCSTPGTSKVCGAASCTGNMLTAAVNCSSAGMCPTQTDAPCDGNYICASATACKTTCTVNTDCAAGYKCASGLCITTGVAGTFCTDNTECASGNCVDAGNAKKVCCSSATCGAGSVCGDTTTTTPGQCIKGGGTTCTTASECGTGFCVDGVCCESLCNGQCQACDLAGAVGKCLGVTGAPHGMRPKCSDGGGDVCKALSCDGGKDLLKCAAFANGLDFKCAESCSDGTAKVSFCDGAGACKAPENTTCAGFACDGNRCKTACTTGTDCTTGYSCSPAGKCETVKASCSDDGTQSVPIDGTAPTACAPYLCQRATGACYAQCTSSDQCVPGYLCGDGVCAAAPGADTEGDGGCATTAHHTGQLTFAFLLLGAGIAARARRRAR